MISMWALVRGGDLETYVATIVLPGYLAHLRLAPLGFAAQATNCTRSRAAGLDLSSAKAGGRSSGSPRRARGGPDPMVCPGICISRLQLPPATPNGTGEPPNLATRCGSICARYRGAGRRRCAANRGRRLRLRVAEPAVRRPRTVNAYLQAWLAHLGVPAAALSLDLVPRRPGSNSPPACSADNCFSTTGRPWKTWCVLPVLSRSCATSPTWSRLDVDSPFQQNCGIFEDGVYVHLAACR